MWERETVWLCGIRVELKAFLIYISVISDWKTFVQEEGESFRNAKALLVVVLAFEM